MLAKIQEKELAVKLRKQGLSYDEIRKQVPVSHASLSFWLRGVKLNKAQKVRLQNLQKTGQAKGALR